MPLEIQYDEALDSYISRYRLLFSDNFYSENPFRIKYGNLSSRWNISRIKAFSSILGETGCFGFNKILHLHTSYFKKNLLKIDGFKSYSENYFAEHDSFVIKELTSDRAIALCIECVKNDINNHGFAYWRRSHQSCNVCPDHNVILSNRCYFCGKKFLLKDHFLSILWYRCDCGKLFLDSQTIYNSHGLELKKSRLYSDLLSYNFHINCYFAFQAILNRLQVDKYICCNLDGEERNYEVYKNRLLPYMEHHFIPILEGCLNTGPHSLVYNHDYAFHIIFVLFSDFDDFLNAVDEISTEKTSVIDQWRVYKLGDSYIEEDIKALILE